VGWIKSEVVWGRVWEEFPFPARVEYGEEKVADNSTKSTDGDYESTQGKSLYSEAASFMPVRSSLTAENSLNLYNLRNVLWQSCPPEYVTPVLPWRRH